MSGPVLFDFDHNSYSFQNGSWQPAEKPKAEHALGAGFSSTAQTEETIAIVKQHLNDLKQNKLLEGRSVVDITSKTSVAVVDYTFLSALKEHVLRRIDDQTKAKVAALEKSGAYFLGFRQKLIKLGASWTQYWAGKKFDGVIEKLTAVTGIKKMDTTQLKRTYEQLQPTARGSFHAMVMNILHKSLFPAFEDDGLPSIGALKKLDSVQFGNEIEVYKSREELITKFLAKVLVAAYELGFTTDEGKKLANNVFEYLKSDNPSQNSVDALKKRIFQHVEEYLNKDQQALFIKQINTLISTLASNS